MERIETNQGPLRSARTASCLAGLCLTTLVAASAAAQTGGAEEQPQETPPPTVVDATPAATEPVSSEEPAVGSSPAEGALPDERRPGTFYLRAYWNRGINYRVSQPIYVGAGETVFVDEEASLTGRIGARLAVDVAGYLQSGQLPPIEDGIELRRLLFYTTGEFRLIWPLYFRVDVGIVNGSFYVDENYLMLKNLPYVGAFKIGQYDAPMSLDLLTGSTARTFMEVAAPVAALAPGLKAGMQLFDQAFHQRLTWAFGYFLDGQTPDVGDASQSFARLAGRITWLVNAPRSPDDTLLHLGLSTGVVVSSQAEIQYKSRPESFLAPALADTGVLRAEDAFPFGAEVALTRGPLLLQAEYLASVVTAAELDDPVLRGYYALAAWMLTGEPHPYDRSRGVLSLVIPREDLSPCAGRWGAWEIAARASYVDLSEGSVRGGQMRIFSAGLNWYWNHYVRWMFNYQHASIDESANDGDLNVFQARFQLVF